MFASWTPTCYINLGAPYQMLIGKKQFLIDAREDVLILRDEVVERINLPIDNIFTIKFNPGGLEAVLGISQTKCAGKIIPLQHVLPQQLLVQIKQPLLFAERAAMVDQYLLNSLRATQPDHYHNLVERAIGEYSASGMQINTSVVAEKLFLTSKTINRYFNKVIGVAPKRYFTTMRARTALAAYLYGKDNFNPYHYGYYDHSHFYRDITVFTGTHFSAKD
jgi:AraC-like DNA-binding protein